MRCTAVLNLSCVCLRFFLCSSLALLLQLSCRQTPHNQVLANDEAALVEVGSGTITGIVKDGVECFGGVPGAQAPVGDLRLRPRLKLNEPIRQFDATGPAAVSPQNCGLTREGQLPYRAVVNIANIPFVINRTEDRITVALSRPASTSTDPSFPSFSVYSACIPGKAEGR